MIQTLLGTSFAVFFGVTAVLTGFAAFMTGQTIANTWRPYWQVAIYCIMLGAVARFLIYGLFDGVLLSLSGYLCGTAVLLVLGTFAFRLTRARRMVSQYPWLYKRSGLFTWQPLAIASRGGRDGRLLTTRRMLIMSVHEEGSGSSAPEHL